MNPTLIQSRENTPHALRVGALERWSVTDSLSVGHVAHVESRIVTERRDAKVVPDFSRHDAVSKSRVELANRLYGKSASSAKSAGKTTAAFSPADCADFSAQPIASTAHSLGASSLRLKPLTTLPTASAETPSGAAENPSCSTETLSGAAESPTRPTETLSGTAESPTRPTETFSGPAESPTRPTETFSGTAENPSCPTETPSSAAEKLSASQRRSPAHREALCRTEKPPQQPFQNKNQPKHTHYYGNRHDPTLV